MAYQLYFPVTISQFACVYCQHLDPQEVSERLGVLPFCESHAAVLSAEVEIKNAQIQPEQGATQ